MVEYKKDKLLSNYLKAVSDGTRRALLTELCQHGPCRVTDLASHYEMSLNAISKHIKVLEKSNFIKRNTQGRDHWIEANLAPISVIEVWLNSLQSIWSIRLDKLAEVLDNERIINKSKEDG
ncbi:MAG: ArsR/SmtB family transcription factor [Marinicella sp.]